MFDIVLLRNMTDIKLLEVVRGPLFKITLMIFLFGIVYRIARTLVFGLPQNRAKPKGNPTTSAIKMMVLKPLHVLSYTDVVSKKSLTIFGGMFFHLTFLLLIVFVPQHSFLWDQLLGIRLPYFSGAMSAFLAYGALISLIVLWLYRLTSPVLRLISSANDHIARFLILLALLSGIIASRWVGGQNYVTALAVHILVAEVLIVYIPFSGLSHVITYFVSLGFYGRSVGISGARE